MLRDRSDLCAKPGTALGNITGITDNYQSSRSQTLGYDNLNRLNVASGAYGSLAFTYDGVGNRTTRVAGATTETYNYASTSNRLNSISVGGSTVRSFSYANSGQVSQDVRGGSTTYDFTTNKDGRLSSAALNSSTVGTYLYNGLEQRVAKAVSSTTTHYVLDDDGHVLSEDDASGNPIREYIWMGDMPVALVDRTGMSPVIYFIHTDHLSRPQKLTDGSAALVWDAVYQPFGDAYSVSGPATNLLMFPGQFYDSETALSQNWHRDYDATLGRYIQSDPIGLAGGINPYAYVGGSPLSVIDPTGKNPLLIAIAVGVAAAFIYEAATQPYKGSVGRDCDPNGADAFNDLRHQLSDQNAIELGKLLNPVQGLVDCFTSSCSAAGWGLAGAAVVPIPGATPVAGKITGYTMHGLNQAISREGAGVATEAILKAVRNPLSVVPQAGGTVKYVGNDAVVILNQDGRVVTTYATSGAGVRAP
jgi:RHS repeat-associated protein